MILYSDKNDSHTENFKFQYYCFYTTSFFVYITEICDFDNLANQ